MLLSTYILPFYSNSKQSVISQTCRRFKYKQGLRIYNADKHQMKSQYYKDYKIQRPNHISTNLLNHGKPLFHFYKQRNPSHHIHRFEQDYQIEIDYFRQQYIPIDHLDP